MKQEHYNLLIVEDSKSMNQMLFQKFVDLKYNCLRAFSLKEARSILKSNYIDYILLDINLPDGNSFELIKELESSHEKIFVLTSQTDIQLRELSYQKGVISFILKDQDFFYSVNEIPNIIQKLELNKEKTILIIDDSSVVQEQLKDIFQNRFFNIEIAPTPEKGLSLILNQKIDFIILDVDFKNKNGIRFLQKNRKEIIYKRKIPVMIISGNSEVSIVRNGLNAGAVDVIKKPYIIEELISKVDFWIDYKRKEDELNYSKELLEQYQEIVDKSSIVSKTDVEGKIIYVNKRFEKISGYKESELIGRSHNILNHPDMENSVFKDLWKTIKKYKKTWFGNIKNRAKNGDAYYVDTVVSPILDQNGVILEYIAIRNDITKLEKSKQHHKSEHLDISNKFEEATYLAKMYKNAMEESNIILRINLERNITYVNNAFCKISGYTKEELVGKPYSYIRHPDVKEKDIQEIVDKMQDGKIWKGIVKDISKYKKVYYAVATVIPIKNQDDKVVEYLSVRQDITKIINLHEELEDMQREIIYKMGEIAERRSEETGHHVKRVAEYSELLALKFGMSIKEAEILKHASPMHDIGKVGIPDNILNKKGKLTVEEFNIMKTHAQIGYEMLNTSSRPILKVSAIVSHEHHEKYNGKGYPRGLKGENIHIYGRITAICDVFDALGSDRPYKKAWELEQILKLFKDEKGEHFDPKLVEIFFENLDEFLKIRDAYK